MSKKLSKFRLCVYLLVLRIQFTATQVVLDICADADLGSECKLTCTTPDDLQLISFFKLPDLINAQGGCFASGGGCFVSDNSKYNMIQNGNVTQFIIHSHTKLETGTWRCDYGGTTKDRILKWAKLPTTISTSTGISANTVVVKTASIPVTVGVGCLYSETAPTVIIQYLPGTDSSVMTCAKSATNCSDPDLSAYDCSKTITGGSATCSDTVYTMQLKVSVENTRNTFQQPLFTPYTIKFDCGTNNNLLPLLTLIVLLCIPFAAFSLWWRFRHQGKILNNYSVDYGEKIELLSSSLSEYKTRIISVKWIVNGEPVPEDENYHGGNIESPSLVISRAALHDAGMYKCVLKLQDEQEEKVITAHLDVIVYTGDKVCLLENIQVTDAIQTVQWMHEKICLSMDDNLFYKGGTSDCPSLTIANLTLNDAGNYSCIITYEDSPARTFPVKLIVHEKLYTTDAGGTIKLLKSIKKNKDVDSVKWFFEGQNISTIDSSIYQGGNKECPPLTICLVDSTNEGTYQCNVIFKNREERHITVKLRVNIQEYTARIGGSMILLPQLSRNTFSKVTWTDASGHVINSDERITSAEIANGTEVLEISRFSGGSIECPSLAINKLTEADSQEYNCQLLYADQSSRTIKVILSVGGERFRPLPPIGNSTNNTVSSRY